ncbi:tyrosine-type recombinase/integrase [Alkalicoccus urumqiensis]|nr:site-specific integrase [Alkalicoccus urumqiensis]
MPFGYSDHLRKKGMKEVTIDEHVRQLTYFFHYLDYTYKKQKELYEITPKDIRQYLQQKKQSGLKVSTLNKIISILHHFFDFAWDNSLVAVDPAQKIKHFKSEMQKKEPLTWEEIDYVLTEKLAEDIPDKHKIIYILACSGLRPEEFRINRSHLLSEKDTLKLFVSKESHERVITISGEAASILKRYNDGIEGSYLISSYTRDGEEKPIQRMTIGIHLKKAAQLLDRESFTTNEIRRALAVKWTEEDGYEETAEKLGIDKLSLMKLLS